MDLTGKVAVVTGGSAGMGEAIARLFAIKGARVVLLARDGGKVEAARQRMANADRILAFSCDVRNWEEVDRAVPFTLERFQRIGVWVNNAGFSFYTTVSAMEIATCRDCFDTNYFGVLNGRQSSRL